MKALHQFVNQSPWEPLPVRRRIARTLAEVIKPKVWAIDLGLLDNVSGRDLTAPA